MPGPFVRKYATLAERLSASATPAARALETPCWEWKGTRRGRTGNYPRVNLRHQGRHQQFAAHRLAKVVAECLTEGGPEYEFLAPMLYRFYALAGFELDHECENPCCVRPSHLTWRDPDEHLLLTIARRRARKAPK